MVDGATNGSFFMAIFLLSNMFSNTFFTYLLPRQNDAEDFFWCG